MSIIIDVSSNSGVPNFSALRSKGVRGVFIKATEGLTYVNPLLHQQYHFADKAGMIVGFYHFARQDEHFALEGAVAEAEHFYHALRSIHGSVALKEGNFKPVLDFEVGTQDRNYSHWRNGWMNHIRKVSNHDSILYTYSAFNNWIKPSPRNDRLWIADYNGHPGHPTLPGGYSRWDMHQFTSNERLGVFGRLFRGDASVLPHPGHIHAIRCTVSG